MAFEQITITADGTVTITYPVLPRPVAEESPVLDESPDEGGDEFIDDDDDDEFELSDDGLPNVALDDSGAAVQWQQ